MREHSGWKFLKLPCPKVPWHSINPFGEPSAHRIQNILVFACRADRCVTSHREGDDNIDLVDLLVFADPPAAGRFDRNRASERQPDAGVGIGDDILPLNDLEQILTGGSEIGRGLRKLHECDTDARQPLCDGLHLPWIVPYPANAEALAEVKQRAFNRELEVQRLLRRRLKHPVKDETTALRRAIPMDADDRRAVVFDRGVDSDEDAD